MGLHTTVVNGTPSTAQTRVGESDTAVWIVHGLPPHEDHALFDDHEGDEVWYANMLHAYMVENIDNTSVSLVDHVENAVYTMLDLLHNEVEQPAEYEPDGFPGAMLSVVRYRPEENAVEYFTIGDSVILLEDVVGDIRRICAADGSRHKPSFSPDNQWCLSFDPEVLSYARYASLSADDVRRAILTTTDIDFTYASTETSLSSLQTWLSQGNESVDNIVSTAEEEYDSSIVPRSNASDVVAAELFFSH